MKKKEFKNKLSLGKETISKLSNEKLDKIVGGMLRSNLEYPICEDPTAWTECNQWTCMEY